MFSRGSIVLKWLLVTGLSAGLLGCGSNDVCDRPLPYIHSQEGVELVVPDDLDQPDKSKQQRIPKLASERRVRSNPCSAGPPSIDVATADVASAKPKSAQIKRSAEPAVVAAAPLKIAPGFDSDDVEATINEWVKSWSEADAPRYLSFYAKDFQVTGQATTSDMWLRNRQELLVSTGPADISIEDLSIESLGSRRSLVRFVQHFKFENEVRSVVKILEMTREGDGWRIRSERVVEALESDVR